MGRPSQLLPPDRPVKLVKELTYWHEAIQTATTYDPYEHSHMEVVERVRNGSYLAVEIYRIAVLIVELIPLADDRKALSVVLTAGKTLPFWLETAITFLEQLARDQDCQKIIITGRAGWERILREYDFKLAALTVTKEIRPDD